MYRHEVLRLCQRHHQLQLLLAGVTGDVYLHKVVLENVCAVLEKLVYDLIDHLFVAGDGACADDDKIVRAELHLVVTAECHTVQRGHRLALTSGSDEGYLLRRVFFYLVYVDKHSVGSRHIAEPGCRADDIEHGAPGYCDLSAVLGAGVDYLLNAVDV